MQMFGGPLKICTVWAVWRADIRAMYSYRSILGSLRFLVQLINRLNVHHPPQRVCNQHLTAAWLTVHQTFFPEEMHVDRLLDSFVTSNYVCCGCLRRLWNGYLYACLLILYHDGVQLLRYQQTSPVNHTIAAGFSKSNIRMVYWELDLLPSVIIRHYVFQQ